MEIEINNLTTNPVNEEFLKEIVQKVLEEEKKEGDLSIVFVGTGRMRELNKKYRRKNRITDVLAFRGNGLGEIVICQREVKKNAKRYNFSFEKELARVLIHGVLHLLGYEHEISPEKAKIMEEKQEYYLSRIKS